MISYKQNIKKISINIKGIERKKRKLADAL